MNFKIKKLSIHSILLLIIIIAAVFFRFYNTPARYGFDYDPLRDALVVDYASKAFQFPLIGAPSGIGSFTFGPWYYYQLILFKIIFPVAYSPWIYIGILSVLTVFIMYKIGVALNGKKLGLILALLTALSPAETGQARALSNPTLIPFYAALSIWMFIKFLKKEVSSRLIFLWGLILGIGINIHYQMVGLLILPIILFSYKKKKRLSSILFFVGGLFLSFLPLLYFNYLNEWVTARGLMQFLDQSKVSIASRWLTYIFEFWPTFLAYFLGFYSGVGLLIGASVSLLFLYLLIKKRLPVEYLFLLIAFALNFIMLRYFPGQREYYYLLYLHPFVYIFLGFAILLLFNSKLGRIIAFLLLLIMSIGMTRESSRSLGTWEWQVEIRNEARAVEKNYPNEQFVFYECSTSKKEKVRGVTFLLNNDSKIDDNGIKLVYSEDECQLPEKDNSSIKKLDGANILNISYATEKVLAEYGWQKITPKTVYMRLFQNHN